MAGIPPEKLEQIRAASDIVDVIGGCLPLKRAGANFTALCPFHKEKTPSFNVNPQKQIFHCFGCHKGGDVFTFVKEYENIGFVDAVRRLAERAKIPLEFDNAPGAQESRHIKDTLLQIHEQIAQRWESCLANDAVGQLARDYLAKRGVSEEAIKLFRLGAAPDAWNDTVNWAKSKGYDLPMIEKAGLIIRREGAEGFYDRFRGRLMFPICDEQGRVIGFSGRILSGDEKAAKYVNSPETPIFTKSKVFFGLDKSKRAILDAGFAIVCEGQLDLIACFMAGVRNVVAPQGTAFTDQHARILKRFSERIVLCFDSDTAGQNAAVRSLDNILVASPKLLFERRDKNNGAIGRFSNQVIGNVLPAGFAIGVVVIPSPHDPDSFIKEFGVVAFRRLLDKAQDFFDYLLDRLCADNDWATDLGRRSILQAMKDALLKTSNAVIIDRYAQKTALRLGVAPEAVHSEFKKVAVGRQVSVESTEATTETEEIEKGPRPAPHEIWLLKLIVKNETALDWLGAHLDSNWIQHALIRDIVAKLLDSHVDGSWRSVALFLDGFDSAEARGFITEAAAEEREIPNPDQQLADLVLRLRNQFLDTQLAVLSQQISQPGISDAEQLKLWKRQKELREQKRKPLAPL